MRRNRRLAVARLLTATALTAAVAAVALNAPVASADVLGPYFATNDNSSDPHIIRCAKPGTPSVTGYCLYTSQDMGTGAYPGNSYPMKQTILYYSDTGYSF